MTKQAKLQIGLDIKPLRDETKKAKQAIEDLGRVKIDKGLRGQIKDLFGKQLQDDAKKYKSELERIRGELRTISTTDAFASQRVRAYLEAISKLNQGLAQTNQLQRSVKGSMFGGGGMGGGIGQQMGGGGGGSMMRNIPGAGLVRGAMSTLGTIGIGLGVAASVSRQTELSRAGMGVRQLTGGNSVSGNSDYGFLQSERLERGKAIASQAGKNMSSGQISKEVNRSEMMERAFGISGEEYAGGMGAARKAGVKDSGKFVADTIGDAVAMRLEGSKVGEYLNAMTGYLESVSKGVNVNQGSLRGFAAALGSIDFFKQDPSRIFDTIQQMETIFKGGGTEYQQFSNYQSIQQASMDQNGRGLTPAGVDVRQMMGMFGSASDKDKANLKKAGMNDLLDVTRVGGDKAMKNTLEREFATAMKAGGGDHQLAAEMFMRNAPGMKGQGGFSTFASMAANGGKMNMGSLNAARKAMQTPEEKAEANMKNFDGSVVKFAERVDNLQNAVSKFVTEGVLKFVDAVDHFSKQTGLFESDISKLAVTVAGFVAMKSLFEAALLGGKGGGGMGMGGKLGGVGTVAAGVMALPVAAEMGTAIGKAMREEMDKWTSGSWSKWWDDFWGHDKKRDSESVVKYATDISMAADKRGVSIPPLLAQERATKLGKQAEKMRDEGKSQKEIDEGIRDQIQEDANEDKEKAIGYARYKRSKREKKNFKPTTQAENDIVAKRDILKYNDEEMDKAYSPYVMSDKDTNDALSSRKEQLESGIGIENKPNGDSFGDPKDLAKEYARGGFIRLEGGGKVPEYNPPEEREARRAYNKWYNAQVEAAKLGKDPERDTSQNLMASVTSFAKSKLGKAHGGPVGVSSINGWARGGSMGRDNIDAKMMGGEFVVNARDASSNMMALVHANSGGKIKPYSEGGEVGEEFAEGGMMGAGDSGIDVGALRLALGGNVEATNMLTKTITQLAAGGGIIKGYPRGSTGMRYGRA